MLYSQKWFKSKDKYTSLTAAPTCSGWSTESDMLIASRRSFCNVCSLQLGSLIWLNAISTHTTGSAISERTAQIVSQIRGVREGLFLFPFPPIPMLKTYSHSHFFPIPLFPIPIPITVIKLLEISKAKKCIIRRIQNIKTYINRSHRHYVTF